MKELLLLLGFYVIAVTSYSVGFVKITTVDGMPQNDVNCIFQDSKGFVWIGTNDGLTRFDGYEFKIFRKEPRQEDGIASNIVQAITEDKQGNIWIGTNDNGLCKFDTKLNKFTAYNNTVENPDLLLSNKINKILADSYNNIWILTSEGLNVISLKTNAIKIVDYRKIVHNPQRNIYNYINDIVEDAQGKIWIGTNYGLRKISPVTYEVEGTYVKKESARSVLNMVDFQDYLLITNQKGIIAFNKNTKFFKMLYETNNISTIAIDKKNNIWIGKNYGVTQLKLETKDSIWVYPIRNYSSGYDNYELTSGLVKEIIVDKSDLVWIGTYGGGVNVYNSNQKLFNHYNKGKDSGSITSNVIRCMHEDEYGGLWIGTSGGGINYLKAPAGGDYSNGFEYKSTHSNIMIDRAYHFCEDTINDYLFCGVGLSSKLLVFDTKTSKELDLSSIGIDVSKEVFCLLFDNSGCLWLGTYGGGLWRLIPDGKGKFNQEHFSLDNENYSLPSNIIRSLLEDAEGNIWIGTSYGLSVLRNKEKYKKNPKFYTYQNALNDPKSISHNYILPLFEDSKGNIWIGTFGGGLNKYMETKDGVGYFITYTTKEGLPNNVIKGILEDRMGNLWISSNRGLSKFDPTSEVFNNFGIEDGLQDYEFSELACCKRKNGEMLFGGVNGFNTFFPSTIKGDSTDVPVVLTQLDILNQPIKVGQKVRNRILLENDIDFLDNIRLKYAENSFTIYFSGLNYSAPHKNKYKYMLEGFDKDWVNTGANARFAKYTNLKPGNYKLKILSSNSDGVWGINPKELEITVIAPWWQSNPAIVVYLLVILIMLVFFRKFSLIGVHKKNLLLMERFEKEKVKELSQMKLHFFTNISHELRTPLTLIVGPIEKLVKHKDGITQEKMEKFHLMIYRNAKILLKLINQLLEFRKFEQGKMKLKVQKINLVDYIKSIFSNFEIIAEQKEIEYKFYCISDHLSLWIDTEKMEKVMFNLLSNAFKFTPNGGKIFVKIEELEENVTIEVEDSGIGIKKEAQKYIFERFYNTEDATYKKYGSTGIGLAFTKGLVEMHRGSISVISEEGKGARFIVDLLKGEHVFTSDEKSFSTVEVNYSTDSSDLQIGIEGYMDDADEIEENEGQRKILIVEDNVELRHFIKDSLSVNYQIEEAGNGLEGLIKCKEFEPDLIISDVMMEGMDGFEMCKAIKSDESICHIPVILLTAKTSSENKIQGYNLGVEAYVTKPFELNVLEAQIKNIISKQHERQIYFNKEIDINPSEIVTTSIDEKFITRVLKIIENNISDNNFTVEELASEYGISKVVLNRKLKALTGKTAKIFIRSVRLKRAAQLLATGRYSVADVTYEVGFSDLKYFRTCFKEEFSLSPSEYKKEHSGQDDEDQ